MSHDYDEPPADDEQQQLPPFDLAAERAVLGSMILSKQAMDEVVEILKPDHFYLPAHAITYEALLDLNTQGAAHDQIALSNRLERDGHLTLCGGPMYPFNLVQAVTTVLNAEQHAGIVLEKA
ncbi:DnaB-like helicase N-terminal domain-containing protein, partial [Streptomyces sp. NPDC005349]|uniref:DnaB-like helicase N-terminal domain-containing protein n=1 Tax=Streptomyces sp. NPDC005349 TaxID=3157037 RepID=UPI0033BCC83E